MEILKRLLAEDTKEKFRQTQIEAVLFDLDDTLIYTAEIFVKCMKYFSDMVAQETGLDAEEVLRVLREVDNEGYKKWGVSPERWRYTLEGVAEVFGGYNDKIVSGLPILMNIYQIKPRVREGVRPVLEELRTCGIKTGLVTHAGVDWTNFKLEVTGLGNYLDAVVVVDEKGNKEAKHWGAAMESLGVLSANCLVIGDNLGGDIIPADSLGAKTMWMPSPWSVYRVGIVPEKTVQINGVHEMLSAMDRLG